MRKSGRIHRAPRSTERTRHGKLRRRGPRRLYLEPLEDRRLLTVDEDEIRQQLAGRVPRLYKEFESYLGGRFPVGT